VVVAIGSLAWSWAVSRLKRKAISRTGLHLLSASLVAFWGLFQVYGTTPGLARAFFVWGSAFNLMAISVFWSRVVDLHTETEGRDRFPFIALGGTVGGIVGPTLVVLLSGHVATHHLLLLSAALMEAGGLILAVVSPSTASQPAESASRSEVRVRDERALGGSWIAGLRQTIESDQLRNLSIYVVASGLIATLFYFAQARVVRQSLPSTSERAHFFATIDLATNVGTAGLQLLVAAPLMRRLGLTKTIAALPLAGAIGVTALVWSPSLGVLFAAQVLRRVVDYALSGPAREVLFTTLRGEHKYKAKSFVDVVAPRFGDAVGAFAETAAGSTPARALAFVWTFAIAALLALRGVRRARSDAEIGVENEDDVAAPVEGDATS
jgi:ATP:ADP antiporter, AAA family